MEQSKRSVGKIKPVKRKGHAILNHARIMKAFGLKMTDLPEALAYLKTLLADNVLQLPLDLTNRQIRLLGAGACIEDRRGFSIGDLALWIQQNPNSWVTWEEFNRMIEKTGLAKRTVGYNYKDISKSFPPETRHPTLSRVLHEVVRTLDEDRPKQRRLLDLAFKRGWTVREFKLHFNGAGNPSPYAHRQACELFEKAATRCERVAPSVRKPDRTIEETAKVVRELKTLLREVNDTIELLSHGPPPPD